MAQPICHCAIEGCNRKHVAKGLCSMHYQRVKNHGSPHHVTDMRRRIPFLQSAGSDPVRCVEWPFAFSRSGYGVASLDGKQTSAHRISLILYAGPPPFPSADAAHDPLLCNNKKCVNPHHLRWASKSENAADKIVAGTVTRGTLASTSGISEDDVVEIFHSDGPAKDAAKRYNVHEETIRRIRKGETWGWLTSQNKQRQSG